MAGLTWFERDVDLHENPKVRALMVRLREPLADAYVDRVYAYCYRQACDRFDAIAAAETIEKAAEWKGRRGVLSDALHAVGILERDAGKVVVHGVADRLAPHLAKRQSDAERQRRRRDKAAASIGRHAPVTRDVTVDVTRESRSNRNRDRNIDQETAALVPAKPLSVHLAGQCPDLAAALARATVPVEAGRKAALWGEADGIVRQVGADAVLACWAATHAKRGGDSIPLAYLIHPMRDLVKPGSARGPQSVSAPQDFTLTLDEVARQREAEHGRPQ